MLRLTLSTKNTFHSGDTDPRPPRAYSSLPFDLIGQFVSTITGPVKIVMSYYWYYYQSSKTMVVRLHDVKRNVNMTNKIKIDTRLAKGMEYLFSILCRIFKAQYYSSFRKTMGDARWRNVTADQRINMNISNIKARRNQYYTVSAPCSGSSIQPSSVSQASCSWVR